MSPAHLINRVSILGTGLIGGSFALALRKYTEGIHITAWDRRDTVARAKDLGAADEIFSGELKPAITKCRPDLRGATNQHDPGYSAGDCAP